MDDRRAEPNPPPAPDRTPQAVPRRVVLVTGMSGAGKSSALRALEDLGYEAVDNLPLSLVASLVRPEDRAGRPLAIGVDTRTRDFGAAPILAAIDRLRDERHFDVRLLFLDCEDEVLRRRFTETRRRHPLAADRPVSDGIRTERGLVEVVRERADLMLDTSSLTPAALRQLVQEHFALPDHPALAVSVVSFSYRHGLPREADLVFDVRFLANPHYRPELRDRTGRDQGVAAFIAGDPGFAPFFDGLTRMLGALLPRFEREGKSYLTIAVGCTGGRHRSVFVAERLAAWLGAPPPAGMGRRIGLVHRDVEGGDRAAAYTTDTKVNR
ncbi:MAG: RNase adapter RapZ [Pseudomonadota bacterium]